MQPARRALISVFDKTGLEELARGLPAWASRSSRPAARSSPGGAGDPVTAVSDVTGFPEILDGRVKTLHPRIHGGILAKRVGAGAPATSSPSTGSSRSIWWWSTSTPSARRWPRGASFEETVEMIDVGGPTMVRAAAKNFHGVAVVVDPADYPAVLAALEERRDGVVPEALRRELAVKAFRHTASYDAAIAEWLGGTGTAERRRRLPGPASRLDLRAGRWSCATARTRTRAARSTRGWAAPACSAASGSSRARSSPGTTCWTPTRRARWRRCSRSRRWSSSSTTTRAASAAAPASPRPTAAPWRPIRSPPSARSSPSTATSDGALAEALADLFVEVLLAPGFDAAATRAFRGEEEPAPARVPALPPGRAGDRAAGRSTAASSPSRRTPCRTIPPSWTCPTRRQPTPDERRALDLAWKVCRYVKSNAIVVANADQTVGIGAGQMSRVDSCRLAVEKARSSPT